MEEVAVAEQSDKKEDPSALLPVHFAMTLVGLAAGLAGVVALLLWMINPQPRVAHLGRTWPSQQLKNLALAMHNYDGIHHRLPPAAIFGEHDKPLLSWRVLILPYLEDPQMQALFDRFKLDEPWDSPHNMELLAAMPKVYTVGPGAKQEKDHTYVQAFVGKGTAFDGTQGCRLSEDFPDGVSNTILLVEGGQPAPWTKPQDIPFAADRALPELASVRQGYFYAAYADGSVHCLKKDLPEKILRALITRNGGEEIPNFD
jgi:hypothetical protein